jgi:hypothetical protein
VEFNAVSLVDTVFSYGRFIPEDAILHSHRRENFKSDAVTLSSVPAPPFFFSFFAC